ncbi:cytochrome P450 [Nocardia higoensis]|uniref:cytochrome P450 n=1 Tax=Nocardia higoensis TaxID=228599 RepID=UPI000594BFAF|nr:cytochrome P450 [Nocardia higoensis]
MRLIAKCPLTPPALRTAGSPQRGDEPFRLYTAEFAADPHHAYRQLRDRYGSFVPVEISEGAPATLVVGYREALQILTDEARFPAEPVDPAERGDRHAAYVSCLARVDLFALRRAVEQIAVALINRFCETGEAELLGDYAVPLTVEVVDLMLGLGPDHSEAAFSAMTRLRDAQDAADAEHAEHALAATFAETLNAKRTQPGGDLVSWLIDSSPELDDAELIRRITVLYLTGTEPTWNLIANTLLSMTTDDGFHGGLLGGALTVRDALDEVLFTDPPLANHCVRYPRQPQIFGETFLPAQQPVLIGLAACNNDPAVTGDRTGNRSHLAWGAGPRACPAVPVATMIAHEAIELLLDALPEIRRATPVTEIRRRPGALHRAPVAVPVTFPPGAPL